MSPEQTEMQIWRIFCMQKICQICISVCSSDVPKKKVFLGTQVKIKPANSLGRVLGVACNFETRVAARLWRSHSCFPRPCHPKRLLCESSAHKGPKLLRLIGLAISKSTGKTNCLFNRGLNDSVPSVVSGLMTSLKNCR